LEKATNNRAPASTYFIQTGVTPMYSSELEYWSESWRTAVHQDEYNCPAGNTKAPSGVYQRPVGVQMYSCTAVRGVQENVAIGRIVAVGFQ
jgi:hypothetical protein